MRRKTVKLGKVSLEVAATFETADEIASQVVDPLFAAREAAIYDSFSKAGVAYDPKWAFNVKNVSELLYIGQKGVGGERSLDDIKELCFDAGYLAAQEAASDFLAMVISPEDVKETGRAKAGKK